MPRNLSESDIIIILSSIDNIIKGLTDFKVDFKAGNIHDFEELHQNMDSILNPNFEKINYNQTKTQIQTKIKQETVDPDVKQIIRSSYNFQALNRMNLELSDIYEALPAEFTDVVPKTHNELNDIIEFYKLNIMVKSNRKISLGKDKQWIDLFKKNDGGQLNCEYCYQNFSSLQWRRKHMERFHKNRQTAQSKCPYTVLADFNCPIGCSYQGNTISQIRTHLIIYHRSKQLQQWKINRQYLKFQEGMIQFEDIIQEKSKTVDLGAKRIYADIKLKDENRNSKQSSNSKEIRNSKENCQNNQVQIKLKSDNQ